MVKEFNSTLWIVKKTFFYHIKIKLKNMDNWLAKTTQDVVFTGLNWEKKLMPCMACARSVLGHCGGWPKNVFLFSCTVSHKNETETETKRRFQRSSLFVLPCYLWVCAELVIDLRYTKTKRKNVLLWFLQRLNTFWARAMWGNSFQKFDPSYWPPSKFCLSEGTGSGLGGTIYILEKL